jgi:hypothetical protein
MTDHRIDEIEILFGVYGTWLTCRDKFDVEHNLRGRVYHNPSIPVMRYVVAVANNNEVKLALDGDNPIIYITRIRCDSC